MKRAAALLSLAVAASLGCAVEAPSAAPAPAAVGRALAGATATGSVPSSVVVGPATSPTTSRRITWRTDRAYGEQRVEVTPAAGGTTTTFPARRKTATSVEYSGSAMPAWLAEPSGLQPGTRYHYRIVNSGGATATRTFTTSRQDVGRWRFLGLGDTQIRNAELPAAVLRAGLERYPEAELVVQTGDVVDRPYVKQQWTDLMTALAPVRQGRDVLVSIGNHEQCILVSSCRSNNAEGFRAHFSYPSNGYEGQRPFWFSTDHQGVRFVVIDAFGRDLERQAAFLDHALATNDERWSVVALHAGPFASRPDRTNTEAFTLIRPVLEKHDVDLVLAGHDHSYARGYRGSRNSTVYATSVSGPKFYDTGAADWVRRGATRVRWAERIATYQVVDVSQDELRYRAVVAHRASGATPAYGVGTTFDDVVIRKAADGTKTVTW